MNLYGGKEEIFPEFIKIGGERFAVNADFRNILRIFAVMRDGNISDVNKVCLLCEWFMADGKLPEIPKIIQAFGEFVSCEKAPHQGKNEESEESEGNSDNHGGRQFCYDFDAEEIYASFFSEYNIDLVECGFLHWRKFGIMLANLPDSSIFKKKIALRFLDLSGFSRENPGFYDIFHARESVQLPHRYTEDEIQNIQEFKDFWERVK